MPDLQSELKKTVRNVKVIKTVSGPDREAWEKVRRNLLAAADAIAEAYGWEKRCQCKKG